LPVETDGFLSSRPSDGFGGRISHIGRVSPWKSQSGKVRKAFRQPVERGLARIS
jgi:hypothetical protein